MAAREPALAALHRTDETKTDETKTKVAPGVRQAYGLFLVEWLGGPNECSAKHGHPRLRMRHARVPVDEAMRDAWLRCMSSALDHEDIDAELRAFLRRRFAEVADFLRNR